MRATIRSCLVLLAFLAVAPFVLTAVLALFAPPLCVYLTVCLLGVLALPAYSSPARKPDDEPPAA